MENTFCQRFYEIAQWFEKNQNLTKEKQQKFFPTKFVNHTKQCSFCLDQISKLAALWEARATIDQVYQNNSCLHPLEVQALYVDIAAINWALLRLPANEWCFLINSVTQLLNMWNPIHAHLHKCSLCKEYVQEVHDFVLKKSEENIQKLKTDQPLQIIFEHTPKYKTATASDQKPNAHLN